MLSKKNKNILLCRRLQIVIGQFLDFWILEICVFFFYLLFFWLVLRNVYAHKREIRVSESICLVMYLCVGGCVGVEGTKQLVGTRHGQIPEL